MRPTLNPLLPRLAGYMQEKANALREAALRSGKPVYDFGIGDPREPTPGFIRKALRDAVPEVSQYPSIAGTPALRNAVAGYLQRRFALALDPDSQILPCAGAKEALFHLPLCAASPDRPLCWYPDPAYPVYERAILFAGATPRTYPLRAERGFLLLFTPEGLLRAEIVSGFGAAAAVGEIFDGSLGAIERALRTGCSVVSSNAKADAYLGRRPSVIELGIQTLACVPLRAADQPAGLIYVDGRKRGGAFTGLDLEILEALSDHTAVVVESLHLDREIRELVGAPAPEASPASKAFLEDFDRRIGRIARAAVEQSSSA